MRSRTFSPPAWSLDGRASSRDPLRLLGTAVVIVSLLLGQAISAPAPAGVARDSGKNGWWATDWSSTDGSGFFGNPTPLSGPSATSRIVIRYTRYATEYDVVFHAPVWGCYTLDATAVQNEASGKRTSGNPDFKRPGGFFAEPLVVTESKRLGVPAANDDTFTNIMDPRYPPMKATEDPAAIQPGPMVPNHAMKSTGTYEEGRTAQRESFSVANIVPQMALNRSPSWAALEDACFTWAKELGQIWIIVGPIFNNPKKPTFAQNRKTREQEIVPCPDHLYYVVIGKRAGKLSAIAFLMPHVPKEIDFRKNAVPVSKIQALTRLNFMPDLGESNTVETTYDPAWLKQVAKLAHRDAEE